MTDNSKRVLSLLEKNIQLNNNMNNVSCCWLKWGKHSEYLNPLPLHHFDIVLGSDLVYLKESIEPMIETVSSLASKEIGTKFILTYVSRGEDLDQELMHCIEKFGFALDSPPVSLQPPSNDEFSQHTLYVFTRTPTPNHK